MLFIEVPNGPAVRGNISLKAPFVAQDIRQECLAAAAGFSVQPVVSSHDARDAGFAHGGFKRRQVGFPQVLLGHNRIESVAFAFRPAVGGKMLGAGGSF